MTTPSQQSNLVSAIIPCYNQAHFLSEAIESILGQTHRHFEIIVVDDGSSDETALVASRYAGVRCIRRDNGGLSAARNTGLSFGAGAYVVFLDADDRLLPEAFEVGVNCLSDHPECAFAYGHVRLVGAKGAPLPSPQQFSVDREHYLELLRHNYIWTPGAVMYRHSVLEAVGSFDPSVNASADFDMNLRIARSYPIRCHDKVILEYRKHDANMSGKFELMLSSLVAVLRSQLKYVKGNREFEKAIVSSISSTREYYGEKMVRQLQSNIRACEWKRAMTTALALLRYYPQGFARHVRRKLFRSLMTFAHQGLRTQRKNRVGEPR